MDGHHVLHDSPETRDTNIRGLYLCMVLAGLISFNAWVDLAGAVGYTWHAMILGVPLWLNWCYPLAYDLPIFFVTRVGMSALEATNKRRWAMSYVAMAIVLGLFAQGTYHALVQGGHQVGSAWWFVLAVSGLPLAIMGCLIHLLCMQDAPALRRSAPRKAAPAPRKAAPAPRKSKPPAEPAASPAVTSNGNGSTVDGLDRRQAATIARDDADLRRVEAEARRRGIPVSYTLIQTTLGCGASKTRRLIDTYKASLALTGQQGKEG